MAATPPDDQQPDAPAEAPAPAPAAPASKRDRLTAKARQAELDRQQAVVDAVADAHDKELGKLGGPLLEPGLGR